MPPRKSKSFFDARKKSSLTTERFTSAKFVKDEFRSAADNKVDLDKEQRRFIDGERVPFGGDEPVPYDDFFSLILQAFVEHIQPLDVAAILKRTLVIVNTNWWIYVRPPVSRRHHVVKKYPIGSDHYVTPEAVRLLRAWSKTNATLPENTYQKMIEEEQEMFRSRIGAMAHSDSDADDDEDQPPPIVGAVLRPSEERSSRHELLGVKIEEETRFEENALLAWETEASPIDCERKPTPKRARWEQDDDDVMHAFHKRLAELMEGEPILVEDDPAESNVEAAVVGEGLDVDEPLAEQADDMRFAMAAGDPLGNGFNME